MTLKVIRSSTEAPRDREISRATTPSPQNVVQNANEQVRAATGVVQKLSAEAVVVSSRAKVDSSERVRDAKGAQSLADNVSSDIRKGAGEAKGAHSGLTSATGRSYVD